MAPEKVILITGISTGIGRCCTDHLLEKGHRVFGTSRQVSGPSYRHQGKLTIVPMDVTDEQSVAETVNLVVREAGRIDVLINNAGFCTLGSVEDTTIAEAQAQFDVNFFGVFRTCRTVLPIMRSQKSGYIINISSLAGLVATPFQPIYCASKFAVEGMSEALRIEVAPFGIKVVLVEPGDFNTNIMNNARITTSFGNPAYRENFQRALQSTRKNVKESPRPQAIAELVEKIINDPSPALRYRIGPASFLVALKPFLPQSLRETLMRRYCDLI